MARILHIEDNPDLLRALRQLLIDVGHQVESRNTIPDADQVVDRFDWFICDGTIKIEHDGADFAAKLHERKQRVVIVSANTKSTREGVPFIDKLSSRWPERLLRLLGSTT